ncbi:MAG TPA: PRC-barrel domain-containing protein [Burkholderiales bacterium]|nr:PRC-barrel domain-containing protein [Burkholderiales bacterium]
MRTRRIVAIVAVLSAFLSCSAAASPGERDAAYRPVWVSRLIGQPVNDSQSRHVGLLKDVVVDLATGEARYGLISDVRRPPGQTLYPVAIGLLRRTDQGLFLEGAGAEQPQVSSAAAGARYMSRLIGMPVEDAAGRDVGYIVDSVIDLHSARLGYLVMRFLHPHVGTIADHAFAVPMSALARGGASSQRLALAVPRAELTRLVGTDGDRMPRDALRYLGRVDLSPPGEPIDVPDAVVAAR